MPRSEKNQYYYEGFERGSRVHQMIEKGAAGHTGGEFIKMLVEDVDRLVHGEPAVVLSGLLAAARINLQPVLGSMPPMETAAPQPVPTFQNSALSRAARARKSYRMDDDEDEEDENEE